MLAFAGDWVFFNPTEVEMGIYGKVILYPIKVVNRLIPGGRAHEIINSCADRDIYNLYDKTKPHLFFTKEEEDFAAEVAAQPNN